MQEVLNEIYQAYYYKQVMFTTHVRILCKSCFTFVFFIGIFYISTLYFLISLISLVVCREEQKKLKTRLNRENRKKLIEKTEP